MCTRSVKIEGALGRRRGIRTFLGLFQQFIEFALQHFLVGLMLLHGFAENLSAAGFFSPQFLNGFRHVLNRRGFYVLLVADYHLEFRIDLETGLATRALHFEQFRLSLGHRLIRHRAGP